ncbi:MAG: diguanylate cyclase [Spirochaetes bacterium]|nr:diguanylate cyclase [Spirochaetota bacterium]
MKNEICRVLLVTDNVAMVTAITGFLDGERFSISTCPGSNRIIRIVSLMLEKERFDAVIIDMVALIYAGNELLKEVRKAAMRPAVILITGNSAAAMAMDYINRGVSDILTRPVNRDHLLMVLNRVMERKQMLAEAQEREPYRQTRLVDSLTGLYNRSYFRERVEQEISFSRRKKGKFSVIFMEIHNLKKINDDFGREAGDDLLKSVSANIQELCRDCDTIARCGGDEFGIILPDASSETVQSVAGRILGAVLSGRYLCINNGPVAASIGISSFPKHAEEPRELLRKADRALTHSRESGSNRYTLYISELNGHPA